MAQQTAVEWLEDNLIGNPFSEKDFAHNVNVFKQAKAMEKEQTIAFTNDYIINVDWSYQGKTTAQYYNEKYSK